jgi:LacI family transcriptional regulator
LDPPLSIIKQPAFEMGKMATELLIQLMESKAPVKNFETAVLTTEMIIRGSTKSVTS